MTWIMCLDSILSLGLVVVGERQDRTLVCGLGPKIARCKVQEELGESDQDIPLPMGRDSEAEQIRRIADDKINHR